MFLAMTEGNNRWSYGRKEAHVSVKENEKEIEGSQDVQACFSVLLSELLERFDGTSRAEELRLLSEELIENARKIEKD